MKPLDAIRSATALPAEMLGEGGRLGVIAPEAVADVIAVEGDPLRDIAALGRVRVVIKGGALVADNRH
jgi:imidazolonepropionase-like amidohydrolase